jgi:hypothetical protein
MILTHLVLFSFLGGASVAAGPLPVDAPETARAVEFYMEIGTPGVDAIRVGTRDHVAAEWIEAPDDWLDAPETWIELRPVFRAGILGTPFISRRLDRASWGFTEVARGSASLINHDGRHDALWDMQGAPVTIWRHDRRVTPPVTIVEYRGLVDAVTREPSRVRLSYTNQDLSALTTLIPRRLTSTELFGATCPTPGVPIPYHVGTVSNAPLIYVVEDHPTQDYVYLVGEGARQVTALRRSPIAGQQGLELVTPPEYSVSTTRYPGLTVVIMARRQTLVGGGTHDLYADVVGPENERNPAVMFGRLMNDPTWGLGLPVDVDAIMAQAALLPAELRLDGIIGGDGAQRPAREWLDMLLEIRGGRPDFDPQRGWSVVYDAVAATSAAMTLQDGPGAGPRTLLSVGQRVQPSLDELVSSLVIEYGYDYVTEAPLYSTSPRTVGARGKPLVLRNLLLGDRDAADRAAHYMAKRYAAAADRVEGARTHEGGRRVDVGDVVHVVAPLIGIDGADRLVIAATKGAGEQELFHVPWSADPYNHVAGTLPPLQTVGAPAGVPVAPLVTQDITSEATSTVTVVSSTTPVGISSGAVEILTAEVVLAATASMIEVVGVAELVSVDDDAGGDLALWIEIDSFATGIPTRVTVADMVGGNDETLIAYGPLPTPGAGTYEVSLWASSSAASWSAADREMTVKVLKR